MPHRHDVFRALADPTRRAILDALRAGDRPARELGRPFRISQPALSQHLRVLRRSGLVASRRVGREQWYRITPAPLAEVSRFVAAYERFWRRGLDQLGDYLRDDP